MSPGRFPLWPKYLPPFLRWSGSQRRASSIGTERVAQCIAGTMVALIDRLSLRGANLPGRDWYATGWIQQESTFWRRSLWDRVGGHIDASLKMAGDFDLWGNFFRHADLYAISTPLGGFRVHGNQKTDHHMQTYLEEAEVSLRRHGGQPYSKIESAIRRLLHVGAMGNRAIPRNRLPSLAAEIIKILPLFYPVKLFVWSSEGWRIDDGYIV